MTTQTQKSAQLQSQSSSQPGDLLCQAVSQDNLTEVQRLLAAGVDANACPTLRQTKGQRRVHADARTANFNLSPLMCANSVEMVDLLLNAGADIHLVNRGGDALSYALNRGDEALIKHLCEAGADLNRCNASKWTRLRESAFHRDPEGIALLLKLGADPSLDRGKLLSAASWYAKIGYDEATEQTIDLLIAAGEDVHATDNHGYTALHCAVHDYAHTPSDEHWWNASSDGSDETATRALLKHGADPNAAGHNGMTPLLLAVQSSYGAEPCVIALLNAGADLEKTGPGGITPLMRAAYRGSAEIVRLLLTHGANRSSVDHFGHDALYYAEQTLASLQSDEEGVPSAEEVDETVQTWRQEQEEDVKLCIALLREPIV